METLDNTEWDVIIVGTGLQQSLLALALSRSAKKILHIDENDYYGGTEAAFSLLEAEEWAKRMNEDSSAVAFSNVSVSKTEPTESDLPTPSLSFSRAYSLELSPQLIYARSMLLQYLVSSKVYRQLEFLACGSWWVYSSETDNTGIDEVGESSENPIRHSRLLKVPNGREDVFQDQVLDFKTKRALMKFLRFIAEYEEQTEVWDAYRDAPFTTFLSEQFKVPASLQAALLALTVSPSNPNQTTTEYALLRIARHLRSIGFFGAGFGAVLPKWGGMSEIVQIACRSLAVYGGVYVLGKGLFGPANGDIPDAENAEGIKLRLKDDEAVTAKWVVEGDIQKSEHQSTNCKLIAIVSSPLTPLFPPIAEDAPSPASAVVVFPSGSLSLDTTSNVNEEFPPVYIFVHSSDTGECPAGQSVLYASTSFQGEPGTQILKKAVDMLLSTVEVTPAPTILWSLQFEQQSGVTSDDPFNASNPHVLRFPPTSTDLVFDDSILSHVKEIWQKIVGTDAGEFLVYEDKDTDAAEDDDE